MGRSYFESLNKLGVSYNFISDFKISGASRRRYSRLELALLGGLSTLVRPSFCGWRIVLL